MSIGYDITEERSVGIITEERSVGIEVDNGQGRVRPVWRIITIRIPDGEIGAETWDALTFGEKREFLEERQTG